MKSDHGKLKRHLGKGYRILAVHGDRIAVDLLNKESWKNSTIHWINEPFPRAFLMLQRNRADLFLTSDALIAHANQDQRFKGKFQRFEAMGKVPMQMYFHSKHKNQASRIAKILDAMEKAGEMVHMK